MRRQGEMSELTTRLEQGVERCFLRWHQRAVALERTLLAYDPRAVLKRGYALIWDEQHHSVQTATVGEELIVETAKQLIKTEVTNVEDK